MAMLNNQMVSFERNQLRLTQNDPDFLCLLTFTNFLGTLMVMISAVPSTLGVEQQKSICATP
jgi:hypothetical protein